MISALLRGAVRRAAMLPLQAVSAGLRAQALERLTAGMVSETTVNGVTLRFHAPSALLRERAANLATKEPDMLPWLDRLGPDDVLWDVGANVGVFTVYAAAARQCRVLAFEPAAGNYAVLARNLQMNEVTDRATAYCLALAGETALRALNLYSGEPGAALSHFGAVGETSRYSERRATLSHGMVGFTIDDFIAQFNPPRPTHLKLDVDGLELPILLKAEAALSDRRLASVMVELSLTRRHERQQAIEFLSARGLRLAAAGAPQGAAEQAANHLFVRA